MSLQLKKYLDHGEYIQISYSERNSGVAGVPNRNGAIANPPVWASEELNIPDTLPNEIDAMSIVFNSSMFAPYPSAAPLPNRKVYTPTEVMNIFATLTISQSRYVPFIMIPDNHGTRDQYLFPFTPSTRIVSWTGLTFGVSGIDSSSTAPDVVGSESHLNIDLFFYPRKRAWKPLLPQGVTAL